MDAEISGGGTVYLVRPLTPAAQAWIDEHIDPDHQSWGDAVAVGHRYIEAIVTAMIADGLEVG